MDVTVSIEILARRLQTIGYHQEGDGGIGLHDADRGLAGIKLVGTPAEVMALVTDVADYYGFEVTLRDPGPVDTSPTLEALLEMVEADRRG